MDSNKPEPAKTQPVAKPVAPKKKSRKPKVIFYLVSLLIMFGLGIWATQYLPDRIQFWRSDSIAERTTPTNDGNLLTVGSEQTVAAVAERVNPSVVSIITRTVDMTYFGPAEQEGAGTGIIVGKDGYILTNKHVVSSADEVTIIRANGVKYDKVKVIGSDPLNDIALLKIDNVKDLPAAELGDSTTIRVGQQVVAIGNSLGQYQNTVTSGIISGTGRPITASDGVSSSENLTDLLQTDAAINPGNSGGPLLNMSGQVIGINTAVAANAEGIGFAIPINATKGMLKQALAGRAVERSFLGVQTLPLTPSIAEELNLDVTQGAYVYRSGNGSAVSSGSPAEKAGIKDKDIITAVNGVAVGSKGSVSTLVGEYSPGDTIELSILRGKQTLKLQATLVAYPANR